MKPDKIEIMILAFACTIALALFTALGLNMIAGHKEAREQAQYTHELEMKKLELVNNCIMNGALK